MTEAHFASVSLRDSEERMRVLLESIEDYAIFSLAAMGVIETWNFGAQRLFGYASHEAVGEHLALLYTRRDAALVIPEADLRQAAAEGTSVDERWHVRKDGSRFFATGKLTRVRAVGTARAGLGYVKAAHDITERKEMQDAVRHKAFHDGLTGLPNRGFLEHLRRSIAQSLRHQVFTSASIGIAIGSSHFEKPEQVLHDADVAYAAKTARQLEIRPLRCDDVSRTHRS